jgi:DNA-binding CsgD family transcriptional regulator/tetratricopeptide (TPR) repeat protein
MTGSLGQPGFAMDLLEREEHLRRLAEALASAVDGRGRIVAIAGEAGAGKTSLVERFTRDNAGRARAHWGACENLSTPEPLLPLRDIFRASGEAFEPGAHHFAAFETLLRLLSGTGRPSMLVLEDVHWADAATLDLIRFLGRRIARLNTLILITYRDEEAGAQSPLRHVLGEAPAGSVERVVLEPLSRNAVSRLAEFAGREGEELFELTGGNPFLVTEALAVDGDATPETVRDATLARAARLSPEGRRLLDVVSVFPRRADIVLVGTLLAGDVEAGLDACIGKGMLMLDNEALKFRHELARRAIETSLAPGRRRELHQKVVNVLRPNPDARASEIAHHAERAGDISAFIEFTRRAADEAARTGASREAAAHYGAMLRQRQALSPADVMDTLEQHARQAHLWGDAHTAMTSMTEAAELRRRSGDRIGLGRVLTQLTRIAWMCGRRAEAEKAVEEAIEVLEAASPGPELAWAYSHRSQLEMLAFKLDTAVDWGKRAIDLAERLGEQEVIIHALGNVGAADFEPPGAAAEELERSFDLAQKNNLHDHVERASCNMACTAYWRRDYEHALEFIDRGARYAAERDLIHWESYLRGWRAMIYIDRGDWAAAEKESELVAGWSLAPALFRSPAFFALSRLRIRRGDPDAETPLDVARQIAASMSELQRTIFVIAIEAESLWLSRPPPPVGGRPNLEDPEVASVLARLRDAHTLALERGTRWVAEISALWLYLLGDPVPSVKSLSQPMRDLCQGRWKEAAEGWRKLGFPYEEAIALSGGDEDAQREALTIFDRLGAAPAAARLRRTMRAGGARAVPRGPIAGTRANPAGLTRRQSQVLELVGEGLSNSEIADKLCISAKTAEHHVSALMARLEATTRREAAAEARRRGLLADAKK